MDYEQIKTIIETRMKQWKELEENAKFLHAPISTITALEGSVQACVILLQDLETAHSIFEANR